MAEPIGVGNDSGVTLYYVPPPNQQSNVFTNFWAGFLSERMPVARQVFAQRLANMSPTDNSEIIAQYDEMIAARAKQIEEASIEAQKQGTSLAEAMIGATARIEAANISASQRAGTARAKMMEDRRSESLLGDEQGAVVEGFELAATMPGASAQDLSMAYGLAREELGDLTPSQRGTAARQMLRSIENVGDPEVRAQLQTSILQDFGTPAAEMTGDVPNPFGSSGQRGMGQIMDIGRGAGFGRAPTGSGIGGADAGEDEALGISGRRVSAPRASAADDEILTDMIARRDEYARRHGEAPVVDFQAPLIGPDASPFITAYLREQNRILGQYVDDIGARSRETTVREEMEMDFSEPPAPAAAQAEPEPAPAPPRAGAQSSGARPNPQPTGGTVPAAVRPPVSQDMTDRNMLRDVIETEEPEAAVDTQPFQARVAPADGEDDEVGAIQQAYIDEQRRLLAEKRRREAEARAAGYPRSR